MGSWALTDIATDLFCLQLSLHRWQFQETGGPLGEQGTLTLLGKAQLGFSMDEAASLDPCPGPALR